MKGFWLIIIFVISILTVRATELRLPSGDTISLSIITATQGNGTGWNQTGSFLFPSDATATLRVSPLANLGCIATNANGDFIAGTCAVAGTFSNFQISNWTTLYNNEATTRFSVSNGTSLPFSNFQISNISSGSFSNFRLENVSNNTPFSSIQNMPSFSNFQLANVSNNTLVKGDNATIGLWNISGSNIFTGYNVGIGTSSPSSPLEISTAAGTLVRIADFITPSMSNGQQNYFALGTALSNNNAFTFLYNHDTTTANRYFSIQPWEGAIGSSGITLTAAGNVGIGTSTPTGLLEIKKAGGSLAYLRINDTAPNADTLLHLSAVGIGSGSYFMRVQDDTGANISYIRGDSKAFFKTLGINNEEGLTKFQVGASDILIDNNQFYDVKDTTGTGRAILGVTTGNITQLRNAMSGGRIDIGADTTPNIILAGSGGNVGIGTTTPTKTLHVVGSENLTGTLYYGALQAQSPHAFVERQGGGQLKPTSFCIVTTTGNILQYQFLDSGVPIKIGLNSSECMSKRTLEGYNITYSDYTYFTNITRKDIFNSTYIDIVNTTLRQEISRNEVWQYVFK